MGEGTVKAYSKVLSWNFPGRNQKDEISQHSYCQRGGSYPILQVSSIFCV